MQSSYFSYIHLYLNLSHLALKCKTKQSQLTFSVSPRNQKVMLMKVVRFLSFLWADIQKCTSSICKCSCYYVISNKRRWNEFCESLNSRFIFFFWERERPVTIAKAKKWVASWLWIVCVMSVYMCVHVIKSVQSVRAPHICQCAFYSSQCQIYAYTFEGSIFVLQNMNINMTPKTAPRTALFSATPQTDIPSCLLLFSAHLQRRRWWVRGALFQECWLSLLPT